MNEDSGRQGKVGSGPAAGSGGPPDLDMIIGWGRVPTGKPVHEEELPESVRAALSLLRREANTSRYDLLAFRSVLDGVEVERSGPEKKFPHDSLLVALSLVDSRIALEGISVSAQMAVLLRTVE